MFPAGTGALLNRFHRGVVNFKQFILLAMNSTFNCTSEVPVSLRCNEPRTDCYSYFALWPCHCRRKEIVSGGHDKETFFERHYFLRLQKPFSRKVGGIPPVPTALLAFGSYSLEPSNISASCDSFCNISGGDTDRSRDQKIERCLHLVRPILSVTLLYHRLTLKFH